MKEPGGSGRLKSARCAGKMIFTGRSVDALDEMRGTDAGGIRPAVDGGRRDASAVAIAAGWFSSLRRPGKRNKKSLNQKQAKSAWDLSVLSTTVSRRIK